MTFRLFCKRRILWFRDRYNKICYGPGAPGYAETVWVEPQKVRDCLLAQSRMLIFFWSGAVVDVEAHFKRQNFHDTYQYLSSKQHWFDGVPWKDTQDYQLMLKGIEKGRFWVGCRTRDELDARYSRLDDLFYELKTTRHFKTRHEINLKSYREEGGVIVCIGPGGEPLLFDGYHRLAIASILGLDSIPVQLGCVDKNSIKYLEKYRSKPANRKTS